MLKIKGIKKVASETKDLRGYYNGRYLQLNYNKTTGKLWTDEHVDFGHASCTIYNDDNILNCGILYAPTTMAEIREFVAVAVNRNKERKALYEKYV